MGKKEKATHKQAGVDIPEEVTLADVVAEIRRGFADVVYAIGKNGKATADVDARLESVRKVLFYIPDVARGVEAAKAKRAAKIAAERDAENAGSYGGVDYMSALRIQMENESGRGA